MPKYRLSSGKIVTVSDENVEAFLNSKDSIGAELINEEAKTEAVATEAAPATAEKEAVDGDLALEDTSLESQPMDPFLVNGKPATEEEFNKAASVDNALDIVIDEIAEPTDYYKEKSTELKQNIAQIEKQLKKYEETGGTIDPRDAKYLQDYKNQLAVLKKDKMGIKQRIGRAASNILPGLESAWESTKAGTIDLISTTIGDPASDFLVGGDDDRGPLVLIDPLNGEEISYKGNKARFRELSYARTKGEPIDMIYQKSKKTVGEATDEYILDEFKKIKTLESSIKEVGSITKGIMSGDVEETVGGVINAVTSLATTIIPAALTRGASLFPQIVAPMYSDFNMTKADTKYPDSKEPIRELVENNETEIAIPLVLGGISMGLEAIGLKGISKQISKQTGKIAPFAKLLLTNNKEGLTEVGQYGVENINKSLAEGNSPQDAFMDGLKSMASLDALENYAQGFVGSGIISAPSTITKALNGQPNSLKIINENIDKLGYLQQQKSKSSSKSFKQAIDLEISETEAKLKEHFTENYYVSKSFNKEQQSEIISIIDQKEKNNKIIQNIRYNTNH